MNKYTQDWIVVHIHCDSTLIIVWLKMIVLEAAPDLSRNKISVCSDSQNAATLREQLAHCLSPSKPSGPPYRATNRTKKKRLVISCSVERTPQCPHLNIPLQLDSIIFIWQWCMERPNGRSSMGEWGQLLYRQQEQCQRFDEQKTRSLKEASHVVWT